MKFNVAAKPVYYFNLSVKQVDVMRQCSALHYDGTCKAAGQPGGHLWGWKNLAEALGENEVDATMHKGEWRDLDLTLKILEMSSYLSDEDKLIAAELIKSFRAIILRSDIYIPWEVQGVEV